MSRESRPSLGLLVVISGPPGAGKTTIGSKIASSFNFAILSKDNIKESLFDSLGYSGRSWSRKIGIASLDVLFLVVEKVVAAGGTIVAEGNFDRRYHVDPINSIIERARCAAIRVHCHASNAVLMNRMDARRSVGQRHPGHKEDSAQDQLAYVTRCLRDRIWEPDSIKAPVIRVDTTDTDQFHYDRLESKLTELVQNIDR